MARITFSPLIAALSGKAADAVFANWKGRSYVRKRVVPHNPQSPAQTVVRDSMGRLAPLWRSLEAQIVDAQDQYAVSYRMSGWNWYVRNNRKNEESNEALILTPPRTDCLPVADFLLTDAGAGSCTVTWTGGTQGAGYNIYLVKRLIETGEIATVISIEDQDSTLVSAETFAATLTPSKTWTVGLAVELIASHVFSLMVQDTIVMGV